MSKLTRGNPPLFPEHLDKMENKREPTFWGPLQVWPMVYILYICINLSIIMKQYGGNASQMCLAN